MEAEKQMEERIQVMKRLKELLVSQRDRFQEYLYLLNDERTAIRNGDCDRIEKQIEIESSIVKEIQTFQKVIVPLEDIYRRTYPLEEESIPTLKTDLETLRKQILRKNAENRTLLREKMSSVRQEIKSLRKPYAFRSPYAGKETPVLVDLTT